MRLLKSSPAKDKSSDVRIEIKMPLDLVLRVDRVTLPGERSEFIRQAVEQTLKGIKDKEK